MAHNEPINTKNPGCILILVDQSGSMSATYKGTSGSKAVACATAVNIALAGLVAKSKKVATVQNRCQIGVIGYGRGVDSAYTGKLAGRELVPVTDVFKLQAGVQDVSVPMPGDAEEKVSMPYWVQPVADGGTPMGPAFEKARQWLEPWIKEHPESFPPIVINITDGEPDHGIDIDGPARTQAEKLRSLATNDGSLLLANVHVSGVAAKSAVMPSTRDGLADDYAKFLFDISSPLPESLFPAARAAEMDVGAGARAFVFNALPWHLIRLLTFMSSGPLTTALALAG